MAIKIRATCYSRCRSCSPSQSHEPGLLSLSTPLVLASVPEECQTCKSACQLSIPEVGLIFILQLCQLLEEEVLQDSRAPAMGQTVAINKWLSRATLDIIGESE